jgi:RimJ/RimL family protein N-acetyltransferase
MNWIQHPVELEGVRVRLVPLHQDHFPALAEIAKHRQIWEHLPLDGSDEKTLVQNLGTALLKRAYGEQYPFTAIDKSSGNIFGSTRLFEIFPDHKKLEIGWTWYDPAYWGKGHNLECKLLMLTYCFEILKANRVQLKTRTTNLRSQAAIRKIGAKEEGVLRKDRIMTDGTVKDTILFSIIDEEWADVKVKLQQQINGKNDVTSPV